MTHLQRLETDVLALHGGVSFRPTLEHFARIGELLVEAKKMVVHGEWMQWLRRVGLTRQSANDYVTVFDNIDKVRHAGHLKMKQFLEFVRGGSALGNSGKSERQKWQTPVDLFAALDRVFAFSVDGAARRDCGNVRHAFARQFVDDGLCRGFPAGADLVAPGANPVRSAAGS